VDGAARSRRRRNAKALRAPALERWP
jgi:hypothetical protein